MMPLLSSQNCSSYSFELVRGVGFVSNGSANHAKKACRVYCSRQCVSPQLDCRAIPFKSALFSIRHKNYYRVRCDHRNGVTSSAQDDGHTASTSGNGSRPTTLIELEDEAVPLDLERLRALCGVEEIPEEVEPLADCLKRASARVEEATNLREALEAEAQEVAQLAVQAREAFRKTKGKLDEAEAELEATDIVIEKLEQTLVNLREQAAGAAAEAQVDTIPKLPSSQAGVKGPGLLATRELGESLDGEEQGEQAEREPTVAELLQSKQAQLLEVQGKRMENTSKVEELRKRVQVVELAASKSEQIAAAAMSAAETAVRDEMEAAAVAKEAQSALLKALQEISVLEGTDRKGKAEEEQRAKQKAAAEAKDARKVEAAPAAVSAAVAEATPAAKKEDGKPKTAKQEERKMPRLVSYQEDKDTTNPLVALLTKHKLLVTAVAALGLAYALLHTTATGEALRAKLSAVAQRVGETVTAAVARLPIPEIPHAVEDYLVTIWLLLTACIAVPLVCQLPGGSAVLGFLAGGAFVGPHALGIIKDVEHVRHIAELGVVFLLFNIGLELSLERLQQMQKFVFGMGSAQVLSTLAFVAYFAHAVMGMSGPAAIVLGGGLALSSTAVAMQVLQDRGENGSRHGRATFSILLFQDLAVVVLLMLVPLLAPSDANSGGLSKIAEAIGIAGVKAIACIAGIIVGGRVLLRPLYRAISNVGNQEIFAATTLLVVLGTSVMTQIAGLSLALGAFLAGLLLAETEFHLQVESDIAPYKGLLMGLFFMTVGMEISVGLFFAKWKSVLAGICMLIVGKTALVAAVGSLFGLSVTQATRAGLLLAPGGEFAFVLLGEALGCGLMSNATVREVFLVVALSMALTPYLAEFGQRIGRMFEKNDVKALQPNQAVVDELRGHVIIAGFGRVGQLIAQLLSERLIPFVALDVSSDRVQAGKELDLPVYFGDAGSAAVLHSVGAHKASCAVITLDTPGANYRTVWALNKNFPQVKTFVRAHDVDHGVVLEKAGATAVVPETLEPSLQLAAAVLSEYSMPEDEVANAIRTFRKSHLKELQLLAVKTGSSLGYGFATRDEESEEEEEQAFETQRAVPEPVG